MSESLEFNLFEDETRECPFKYFEAIRHLDKPVYFMPELGAYYISRYEDVRFIKKHPGRKSVSGTIYGDIQRKEPS